MKLLRWLGIIVVALVVLLVAVGVAARFSDGPVEEVIGPHIVSGGWWTRETTRAYHYVRTRSGRWLWIYNDRRRRRWFLHGEVE